MAYSISQVARMAGITARTLRHYDEIGLLAPAHVSANGYRWYDRPELLRLQRIMLLRGLGMPLAAVAETLNGHSDEEAALRHHRMQLLVERERIDQVIETVERTIANLVGEHPSDDAEFFRGLTRARRRLREDLRARYGDGAASHLTAAEEHTGGWTRQQHEQAAEQGRLLLSQMATARLRGASPCSEEAFTLVTEHYQQVRALWPADATTYHALGDLVLNNLEQRAMVAAVDADLPEWLAAAIQAYATQCLGHRDQR